MEKISTSIGDKKNRMESVKACCSMASNAMQKRVRKCCSYTSVKRHLPIFRWLPRYKFSDLTSDIVAGFTIGLTIIPQSMAYAIVAGLLPQYGLYSAFMGSFVYCIFGSTEAINIGPTAIMGLLTADHVKRGGAPSAVLLCFYAGCFELASGILNLGFLIDFISAPVISGFSSAAAIIISITQLKGLLGVKIEDESFLGVISSIKEQKDKINYNDLGLGLACVVLLVVLRLLGSIEWNTETVDIPGWRRILRKSVWLISAGRNAIIVILASVMTFVLINKDANVFSLTGHIPGGLPAFQVPQFRIMDINTNVTHNELDSFKDYGSGLILVPLLAILEHIAIAKVFARGKSLDSTQELISLGLANIAGSFVSSFPVTGSFSRTALNASCGVKTPLGGILTGVIVLLAIAFLAPSFYYIPKASLSAVIITAVIVMIEYRLLPYLWKTKKTDLFVMLLTFLCCIFSRIEYGILVGICASIMVLLYNTARPRITSELITINGKEHILIRPDRMLNFPSVEHLRSRILKATKKNERIPAILDGIYLCGMDYTVIQCVKELIEEFKERNQMLIFVNLKTKVVKKIKVLAPKGFIYYDSMTELEAAMTNGVLMRSENLEISVISNGETRSTLINNDQQGTLSTEDRNIQMSTITSEINGDIHPIKQIKIDGKDEAVVYLPDLSEERQSRMDSDETVKSDKNITNEGFVCLLREYAVLLNKSQVPAIKNFMLLRWERLVGKSVTEGQLMKKINNMKTKLKVKVDIKKTGNKKIILKKWEKDLLELMDGESNPTLCKVPAGALSCGSNVKHAKKNKENVDLDTPSPPPPTIFKPSDVKFDEPQLPPSKKKNNFVMPETEKTKNLTTAELHCLVLLEQLAVIRLKKDKYQQLQFELEVQSLS